MRAMNREKAEEAPPAARRRAEDGLAVMTRPDRALVRVLVQAQREVEFERALERNALNDPGLL